MKLEKFQEQEGKMISEQPLVTMVIPTYNQGVYLPACIDHCLFQSYENLELVIVDGGSTDSTKSYLRSLKESIAASVMHPVAYMTDEGEIIRCEVKTYPQNRDIHIFSLDDDPGATATYNMGLRRARGKYCTYIAGDDLPHPHMIEEMVAVLEDGRCDFVYSDMNLVDDEGRIIRQMRLPEYSMKACLADWFHLGVSKLYRRSLHEGVGLMDESYTGANDYDHYLRFAMAGCRFFHLEKILYSVRWHGPGRKTGQHTDGRYAILLDESRRCAQRARGALKETEPAK